VSVAGLEHVMDLSTGQGCDREFEGERPPSNAAAELAARRLREAALARLQLAAVSDQVVRDLLVVLGLPE